MLKFVYDSDKSEILGEGQFACCFRGKFNGTIVAVKMLKSHVQTEDFKNYLNEVKLMAYIGQHPNIIQFYGAVIEKLEQSKKKYKKENGICCVRWWWTVRFFCRNCACCGRNESVRKLDKISTGCCGRWEQDFGGPGPHILLCSDCLRDGIFKSQKCKQICKCGPFRIKTTETLFLNLKVIHGDLAARNVLLFEGLTVKITDFGLSKNLYESSFYSRRHQKVSKF